MELRIGLCGHRMKCGSVGTVEGKQQTSVVACPADVMGKVAAGAHIQGVCLVQETPSSS